MMFWTRNISKYGREIQHFQLHLSLALDKGILIHLQNVSDY